jgi:ferredoxin
MTVGREPRLVDVRQIGPNSECDISGRCSVCGVILIARLNSRGDATAIERREQLENKLERLFDRHVSEMKCGSDPCNSVVKEHSPHAID